MMNSQNVEREINSIPRAMVNRYNKRWEALRPKSHYEHYLRFMFAFFTVRTRWEKSVTSYMHLKKMLDNGMILTNEINPAHLNFLLRYEAKCGLIENKIKGMTKFHREFWANPTAWQKKLGETWCAHRDRINSQMFGLGIAKTSFAVELVYPMQPEVVCIDTRIARLYGLSKITDKNYREIEKHWCDTAVAKGIPPAIARHICWDKIQNRSGTETDYWSFVFDPLLNLRNGRIEDIARNKWASMRLAA